MKGPPHWRSYIGTPLTTKRGVNIGALCILDDKPHQGFSDTQKAFCETIARTIMGHLEINREAEERKKGTRMSRGLNAFVEGKTWLGLEITHQRPEYSRNLSSQRFDEPAPFASETRMKKSGKNQKSAPQENLPRSVSGTQIGLSRSGSGTSDVYSKPSQQMPEASLEQSSTLSETRDDSHDESEGSQPPQDLLNGHRWTFSRAANLLRQSLDLQDMGGIIFLDTSVGFTVDEDTMSSTRSVGKASESESDMRSNSPDAELAHERHGSASVHVKSPIDFQKTMRRMKRAELLGLSTSDNPLSLDPNQDVASGFNGITEKLLSKMLKQYPRGHLWSFDEDGMLSSSEEEITATGSRKSSTKSQNKARRKRTEAKLLQSCFPGGKLIMYRL